MDKTKVFRIVLALISISCIGYFAYYYIQSAQSKGRTDKLSTIRKSDSELEWKTIEEYREPIVVSKADLEPKVLPEYETLFSKNKNLIGWVKIADTNIDYPVVKSINGNGEYYLDHDFDGGEDRNGTIFMDDDCDPILPSDNLILYGHNMKSGKMFGDLDKYKNKAFFESHGMVYFDTIYRKGIYEVLFAFPSKIYSEADITFKYYQFIRPNSEEEFNSGIKQMQELSLFKTGKEVTYGDELLTLSTCDYDEENGRFVVVCRRVN